jgi:hypothetical protein
VAAPLYRAALASVVGVPAHYGGDCPPGAERPRATDGVASQERDDGEGACGYGDAEAGDEHPDLVVDNLHHRPVESEVAQG